MKTPNINGIAAELDLFNKVLDYHYTVEQTALETGDIGSDDSIEYVAELIAESEQYEKFTWEQCVEIAKQYFDEFGDKIIDEIIDRDRDAMEYADEIREARKGQY